MITPDSTAGSTPAAAQAENDQAAQSALTNLGNTVRASWPFSLDTIRSNIAYMSPEAKELLVWAFGWCTDHEHPVHMEEFCLRIGYSKNTLWKVLSGKYKHPEKGTLMDAPKELIKGIRDFRKIETQRQKLGRVGFVVTPTVRRIHAACDLARKSQTPVFLYGASQIGKTEACRQYCIDNNHGRSVLVELEAVNGLRGLLQAVAVKVGVNPNATTPDLIERLKRAVTRDMVVILDEVHLLANVYLRSSFFKCMETVRRIFVDHCKCGLVLTFTLLGYNAAEKEKARELEQIFRRGVHRYNLGDRPTVADVAAIVGGWDLEMPARKEEITASAGSTQITENVFERLGQLAKEEGLRAITERLRAAAEYAADKGDKIAWEHFVIIDAKISREALAPKHGWGEGGAS